MDCHRKQNQGLTLLEQNQERMATKGGSGVIYTDNTKERRGMRMENPFTLKVGQVFTGFGIGCGIGIGVGRPLNIGTFLLITLCVNSCSLCFSLSRLWNFS